MIWAYFIHLAIFISIYVILSVSLQLSFGLSGFLNFGHIAFFGVGAYVFALLSLNGFPFLASLFLALVAAGVCGFLISILVKKFKGDYFALVTLGFSFVAYSIFLNWEEVTGGSSGLFGIARPDIFAFAFVENSSLLFLLIAVVFALASYLFMHRVCASPFGKVVAATRDDELAAQSLGKNTKRIKTISFVVAASCAGVAGGLFASYLTYIDPSSFTFLNLIPILLIVIIGGLGSLPGTVLAVIIIILLPEALRFLGLPSAILGSVHQMLYAAILVVVLYFRPRGFYGKLDLK